MTTQQLEAFCAAAKYLNFTKAAEELFSTQPTVSRQIRNLEDEWGYELFTREKQELRLTPAGAIMLGRCRKMLEILESGLREVQEFENGTNGSLHIGILESMDPGSTFQTSMDEFFRQYPGVAVNLKYRSFGELRKGLESEDFDLIFTMDFELSNLTNVVYDKIRQLKWGILISRSHPLAQKEDLSVADLKNEVFILPDQTDSPGRLEKMNMLLESYGFKCEKPMFVPNTDSMYMNVRAGRGVAIIADNVRSVISDSSYRFLRADIDIEPLYAVCVWRQDNMNPAISLYTKILRESAESGR